MFSDEYRRAIEQVKLRAPIEDVVRERVPDLKKSGALWVACCPFHDEKTPSFKVDPRRGTWHCFGACSSGGDQLDFVQRFDRVEFRDAVEILAARSGVELPRRRDDRQTEGQDARLLDVLERAAGFYRRRLESPEGRPAREYLAQRGLDPATCAAFGLGWAPATGRALCDELARGGGAELKQLEDAGLARTNEQGRAYDFFRGRLAIPIRDSEGRAVGFGARRLADDGSGPKYVNTPETRLFKKSRLVFALDRALPHVRRSGHLVIVEGYTDVIAAHQVGLENVVAVLGTATTEDHAAIVRRTGARRVSLVFDGDEAGRKAAFKALAGLLPGGVELEVVELEGGQDPCDLLVRSGREPFLARLELARGWFEFVLAGLDGLRGADLSRQVDQVLELLGRLPKPVHRESLLCELAERIDVPAASLREQWSGLTLRARGGAPPAAAPPAARPAADRLEQRAFAEIAGALLCDPSLVPLVRPLAGRCPDPELGEILDALIALHADERADLSLGAVLDRLGERPARARVVPLAEAAGRAESPRALLEGQIRFLETRALVAEKTALAQSLYRREASVSTDRGEAAAARDEQAIEIARRAGALLRPPQSVPRP